MPAAFLFFLTISVHWLNAPYYGSLEDLGQGKNASGTTLHSLSQPLRKQVHKPRLILKRKH